MVKPTTTSTTPGSSGVSAPVRARRFKEGDPEPGRPLRAPGAVGDEEREADPVGDDGEDGPVPEDAPTPQRD